MANISDSSKEPANFHLFSSLRYDPSLLKNEDNAILYGKMDHPGPFYMLPYHRDRLLEAARHFQWQEVISRLKGEEGLWRFERDLVDGVKEIHAGKEKQGPLKIRALYDQSGDLEVDISRAPPVSMSNLFPRRLTWNEPSEEASQGVNHDDKLGYPCFATATKFWCVLVDTQPTSPSPFTAFKTTRRDTYDDARARTGIKSVQDPSEVILVNTRGEIMEGSLTTVYFFRGRRWVTPPLASGGQAGTTRRWLLEQGLCEEEVIRADSVVDGEYCYLSNGVRGVISGKVKLLSP